MTTDIIAILILLLVIMIGLINAKIYNIFHGLFSIIGISQILALISFIGAKQGWNLSKYNTYVVYVINSFTVPLQVAATALKIEFLSADKYQFYIIPILVFVISFILASLLRKLRKGRDD